MTQTVKTLIFVVVAVASVAVAAGTYYSNKPADIADFSDVGEKFYPKFDDPNSATGLRVAAYNDATGKTDVFKVEYKDGMWRIPSHHDYPADGKDRLAKTAASMIGVVRQALVERSKSAQKRYDLLDPLDTEVSGTEGRGDRVTLYQGDNVLVDFIVGKKMENSANLYYVRRADEDRIYTADLGNLEVSTKFADWIQKDILTVEQQDVRELTISRYYVDEAQGKVVQQGRIEVDRESAQDEWHLEGLDATKEKLKTAEINSTLAALEDLQIVGVRPKPEELSAGLKSKDGSIAIDPFIQQDLAIKGVFLSRRGEFVYNEGKVNVGTSQGVVYELGFGEEFVGSDVDIEIGGQKSPKEEAKELATDAEKKTEEKAEKTSDDKPDAAEKEKDDKKKEEGLKKSRYLFVTVLFDKKLLGEPPVAPQKPEKPAAQPEKKEQDAKADNSEKADKGDEKKPDSKETPADKKEAAADDPLKAYEEAMKEYQLQQEVYETKKKQYEEQLQAGEKRVAELNARFADWYYVISEEVFDRLKLTRDALVEPQEPAAGEEKPQTPATPAATPAATPPAAMEKPKAEPQSEQPAKTEKQGASESDQKGMDKPKPSEPATKSESKPKAETESKPVAGKPASEKSDTDKKTGAEEKLKPDESNASKPEPKADKGAPKSAVPASANKPDEKPSEPAEAK